MFSFERFEVDKDKANHFVYGSVLTVLTLMITGSALVSAAICVAVAVLKEVWDLFYGSGFDWLDIAWTLFGGAVVIVSFFSSRM